MECSCGMNVEHCLHQPKENSITRRTCLKQVLLGCLVRSPTDLYQDTAMPPRALDAVGPLKRIIEVS